eukprot:CAMPEP_0179882972 /NCGR_PEP_ID=MMETSP0982-20121206/28440_1 /TAXON_ID=483367 /ORGANISM="non described non described, Strain CCMP 2436" /LENGTH=443 /DNA_ID=CAMNT_0021777337 /DNA_START=248 /DNA_END=1576 /DNA_ORIENTATION=-
MASLRSAGYSGPVGALHFLPESRNLLLLGVGRNLHVHEAETGELLHTAAVLEKAWVHSLSSAPNALSSAGARLVLVTGGRELALLEINDSRKNLVSQCGVRVRWHYQSAAWILAAAIDSALDGSTTLVRVGYINNRMELWRVPALQDLELWHVPSVSTPPAPVQTLEPQTCCAEPTAEPANAKLLVSCCVEGIARASAFCVAWQPKTPSPSRQRSRGGQGSAHGACEDVRAQPITALLAEAGWHERVVASGCVMGSLSFWVPRQPDSPDKRGVTDLPDSEIANAPAHVSRHSAASQGPFLERSPDMGAGERAGLSGAGERAGFSGAGEQRFVEESLCSLPRAHEGAIFNCVWHSSGGRLATIADDRRCVVWLWSPPQSRKGESGSMGSQPSFILTGAFESGGKKASAVPLQVWFCARARPWVVQFAGLNSVVTAGEDCIARVW